MAVDANSGGLYKLSPEQISGTLTKQVGMQLEKGTIYVAVVLQPDPTWQKTATLQPSAAP